MYDKEYKQIRRLIIILLLMVGLIIIGFALWGNKEIKVLKQQIATVASKSTQVYQPIIVVGQRGEMGQLGPVGPVGPKGDTGLQGWQGIQGIQGEQGPVGPQGIQGPPGRTIFIYQDNKLCKYAGDDDWQPISECQ